MRHLRFLLFFLLMLPVPVYADPGTIATALGVSLFWGTVISVVGGALVSYGISLLANALFSKPRTVGSIGDLGRLLISNDKSTVAAIPVIYGRHKVGGYSVYEEIDDTYFYKVVIFCEGRVGSVEKVLIDGIFAENITADINVYTFVGTDDQSNINWTRIVHGLPITRFSDSAPGWTSNHRLRGCAGAAMIGKRTDVRYFPRIPTITGIIQGRRVYDPRTTTTDYSNNPALCIRDYYISTRFGAKISTSRLDESSWIAAANYFDEQVDYGGGNQSRFTLNMYVDTSKQVWDNIEDMCLACNSLPIRVNGKHGLLPLKPEATSFSFTDDNVVGGIQVERLGRRFKRNKITAQWINPSNDWQADIYTVSDATFKALDNDIELSHELQLAGVTNRYQVAHLCNIALRQSRLEEKISFQATHEALKVEIGDVVDLTHSLYGYNQKLLRVTSLSINPDGSIGVGAEEYDEDVYDVGPVTAEELEDTPSWGSPFEVDPPGTPSVSLSYSTNSAGFAVNVATLTWGISTSAQIAHYLIEYRESGDTDWIISGTSETTSFAVVDIAAGTYDFAVSAVNSIGTVSERATLSSFLIVDSTDIPDDVTNFRHEFTTNNMVVLKWDQNTDAYQGGGYRIKVSSATSGASWSDFPQLNITVGGRETTVTLGIIEGTYMIKAFNVGGTESENEATIQILIPDNDEWSAVTTVTESTQFTGTKSQVEVSTGTLMLSTDGSGNYYSTGNYTWAGTMNFGGTFACRLTRVSSGTISNTASNWDSFPLNIDEYNTILIDDMAGATTVDVRHFYGTTTESASTGPWGSYNPLQVTETVARQVRFQTTIQTSQVTETPNIQELSATAWMKRRVESNHNVSVSSSGGSITFTSPFYSTPTIQVFPFNGSAANYVTATTSQMSRTGFEVSYFTSSGGQTAGKISWAAYGIGKEVT